MSVSLPFGGVGSVVKVFQLGYRIGCLPPDKKVRAMELVVKRLRRLKVTVEKLVAGEVDDHVIFGDEVDALERAVDALEHEPEEV